MRAPKFNVGQLVAYFPPPGLDAPRGAYQVTAEIPFRVGHHFASELVNYGRRSGLRPAQIPFQSACTIFTEVAREVSPVGPSCA